MLKVAQVIPEIICDLKTRTRYRKCRFLGKGTFGKYYEIQKMEDNQSYTGKIVSKKILTMKNQRQIISGEIQIHQSLKHTNVVQFYGFFEDVHNIYIVLELCRNRSMEELHKRRKIITEPETRYFLRQIISGVQYLHKNRIIHRDLTLGNLFLNCSLVVKIGNFGLAVRLESEDERKNALCDTSNYIALEIVNKGGYSFEVDIWSIGCIMYALLIGKLPFETASLKETYSIKKYECKFTLQISRAAKQMITSILQCEPKNLPNIDQLEQSEFIQDKFCPTSLPITSLTMEPKLDKMKASIRKPLLDINNGHVKNNSSLKTRQDMAVATSPIASPINTTPTKIFDAKENFIQLKAMLYKVLETELAKNDTRQLNEMTDPQAQPMYWVTKWVDYYDKYGFGYQLSDEGVGVMFNDGSKLYLLPNGINVHYVDINEEEIYMTINCYPSKYNKKMKLLSYFNRYMQEEMSRSGASVVTETDSIFRTPHLHQFVRSTIGMFMQLNNGTVQMNFNDHSKIIMCPLMAAITYIDVDETLRTFKFATIEKNGCSLGLQEKMRYVYRKISMLLEIDYSQP